MISSNRRKFLKKLTIGSSGIILSETTLGRSLVSPLLKSINLSGDIKNDMGTFPFFEYLGKYNIGDYIPKDQGGKFIQMELLKTEEDRLIVERIRNGLLEKVYGNPIDWTLYETNEIEKSVWLNRFYFLPSFARQYYLSGDISYLDDMMKIISIWIENNPRLPNSHSKTINWRDMQVAWRSIHWSWCYFLTEKSLSCEQKEIILNSLKQHADILLSGFGKQSLNEFNHQAHGALAMLYLGVLFPMLKQADELKKSALKIISHHLENAFYSDGGNVEQMFGYYPFETHIFRDTYLLCIQNNIEVPPNLLSMLEKMALFLSAVAQPNSTMPPVNDSFEMTTIPMLTTLNEITGKRLNFQTKSSKYFPETQIAIMRGEDSMNKWYVLANPAKSIGAHAHAGRLAFTLWHNERPILIDSGCCNYDNSNLVKWFRTSRAHNTVIIDGKSDEATSTDRLWAPKRITKNSITHWIDKDSYTYCRMVSPVSESVNSSVSWIRSLALVKNHFLILHDCFESNEEHNYELLFHFPSVPISANDNSKTIRIFDKNPLFVFPADSKMIVKLTVSKGLVSINGESKPSPIATFQFKGKGTVHSVIIFMPDSDNLSKIKIQQKIIDEGIGVKISQGKSIKTILLMRNYGFEKLSVYGHQTQNLFDIF